MSLKYDPPTSTCLKTQAGTSNLRKAVREVYPVGDLGIYACRNVGKTASPSVHREGRAWDAGCNNFELGWDLFHDLVDNADRLSVQRVIWDGKIWTVGSGIKDYDIPKGGSAHRDHLHIEQNWDGAKLTYAQAKSVFPGDIKEIVNMAKMVASREVPGTTEGVLVLFDDGAVHTHRTHYWGGPNALKSNFNGQDLRPLGQNPVDLLVFSPDHYTVVTAEGTVLDFTPENMKFLDV